MNSIVPVIPGRPVVIMHEGWRVYIAIHDAEFLRLRAEWRAKHLAVHPDQGGDPATFRKVHEDYERFLRKEIAWYERYGLELPTPPKQHVSPVPSSHTPVLPGTTLPGVLAHRDSLVRRVNRLLVEQPRTLRELMDLTGKTRKAVYRAISRLREAGAVIHSTKVDTDRRYETVRGMPLSSTSELILDVLGEGRTVSIAALAERLERKRSNVEATISRMRSKGVPIIVEYHDGQRGQHYRLGRTA